MSETPTWSRLEESKGNSQCDANRGGMCAELLTRSNVAPAAQSRARSLAFSVMAMGNLVEKVKDRTSAG